jgi:hypothetical protein
MASTALRNNSGIDITDKELRKTFPAIFNTRRSVQVSEDYQFYNSLQVIELMQAAGLRLVEVSQERMGWSKKRQPHTQIHTMRFMQPELALRDFGVGDSRPEVVCMNSHDGRCVFRAMAGVFRLICSNGMIVADQQFGSVIRRHYGEANAFAKVKEIVADMPRVVEKVSQRIADWSALDLAPDAQLALARLCMKERKAPEWLLPEQVLEHRRQLEAPSADGSRDLWTTFNVLQESLTNATVHRLNGEGRARAIQPVGGTVGNVGLNQALWATADTFFDKVVEGLSAKEREQFEAIRAERGKKAGGIRRKLKVETA